MPQSVVVDAAWALMADQASRYDDMLANHGERPHHREELVLQVWGSPLMDQLGEFESASEVDAAEEMAALAEMFNGRMGL